MGRDPYLLLHGQGEDKSARTLPSQISKPALPTGLSGPLSVVAELDLPFVMKG